MSRRSYEGPALDATGQHITEAPRWQRDGETVDVADDRVDAQGEERTENVPHSRDQPTVERPDVNGQSTLEDWGCSR